MKNEDIVIIKKMINTAMIFKLLFFAHKTIDVVARIEARQVILETRFGVCFVKKFI